MATKKKVPLVGPISNELMEAHKNKATQKLIKALVAAHREGLRLSTIIECVLAASAVTSPNIPLKIKVG